MRLVCLGAMNDPLARRHELMERLETEVVDVVVVGGGINGAGVLVDAASRGLDTVLVERDDLAVGTSSRSSKLIHGGLRYLERFHFGLVREALAERDRLARLAPHLVTLSRFVVPVVGGRWQLPYVAAGLTLYDRLGGAQGGRFEIFTPSGVAERMPAVDVEAVVGGFEYTDGICDDARVVMAVAETARGRGGRVLTHATVDDISSTSAGWELHVVDGLSGRQMMLRTRAVIDVTGAFEADRPELPAHGSVTTSRGIHLVVGGERLPGRRGMTIRVSGRVVFVIPWGRRWVVGTTDVAHSGPIDRPVATAAEVDYLLETVNRVLAADLTRSDVLTTFAGIRPLAGRTDGSGTAAVSREHRIRSDGKGMVSVRGGKFTTYRLIAAEAVDEAADALGVQRPSSTDVIPLVGAAAPPALEGVVARLQRLGLSQIEARWMVGRHGTESASVLEHGRAAGVDGSLHPDMPYRAAEAWWAIHREGAFTLDDVLSRRTRLAIETSDHGLAAAPLVADLLAEVHGWSPEDRGRAIDEYAVSASREYGVPG